MLPILAVLAETNNSYTCIASSTFLSIHAIISACFTYSKVKALLKVHQSHSWRSRKILNIYHHMFLYVKPDLNVWDLESLVTSYLICILVCSCFFKMAEVSIIFPGYLPS